MGIGFTMKGAPYKIDNTPIYHGIWREIRLWVKLISVVQ